MPKGIYTTSDDRATSALCEGLRQRIAAEGPLDFADFMASALYHPDFGYYARGTGQVGRGGDFFTSVSVGPVFGELLARWLVTWWQQAGCPKRWRVIEMGAHDGTLAADILTAMTGLAPEALAALEYAICEPLPRLRTAQQAKLQAFGGTYRAVERLEELASEPLPGVAFGNEVLDALPFHVIEWRSGRWWECQVGCDAAGAFCWVLGELPPTAELAALGSAFPEGYRTEICTDYTAFMKPLLAALSSGRLLWIDYGLAKPDYYHPARTAGTLRTFSRHRAAENPLERPGETDITAQVDFTAVADVCLGLGGKLVGFQTQAAWLTAVARPWLLAMEGQPDARLIRQFQTLIHPAQLGTRFQMLEISWREATAPVASASDWHRLALPSGGEC